jgi:hypothetical protein
VRTPKTQALDLVREEKLVKKDVADIAGKLGDVVEKVGMQLARILALQAFEGEGAEIVDLEVAARCPEENHILGCVVHAFR